MLGDRVLQNRRKRYPNDDFRCENQSEDKTYGSNYSPEKAYVNTKRQKGWINLFKCCSCSSHKSKSSSDVSPLLD